MATDRKAIFISGGASGIGRAIAVLFAERGWFVGIGDIDQAAMAATAAALPTGAVSQHQLDVRSRLDWSAALADFWAVSGGRLDVLCNNAGIGRGGAFGSVTPEHHDALIDINFKGVVYGAEAALPYLSQTPGSCLLNTGSASGLYGAPGLATYAATKFAVRGLTESLEREWAPLGIKVRSIMPSFIETPLLETATAGSNRSVRDMVHAAGLEITPVEAVAVAAWDAVHGTKVHSLVGKTARRIALLARFAPWLLRRGMKTPPPVPLSPSRAA